VRPTGAQIVVVANSQAIDLEIVEAALRTDRFGYVIASATKRARFLSQMRVAGLSGELLSKTRLSHWLG
jgi:xanthine/CO dehydrogenase XdhC/CoxF family maturation factor